MIILSNCRQTVLIVGVLRVEGGVEIAHNIIPFIIAVAVSRKE
jgi:hypothetical protein